MLIKSITLLYREQLLNKTTENKVNTSENIVKDVLETLITNTKDNQLFGGDAAIIEDLKYIITDMMENPNNYTGDSLEQTLKVTLKDHKDVKKILIDTLKTDMSPDELKKSLISLRSILSSVNSDHKIKNLISSTSYKLNMNKLDGKTIKELAGEFKTKIEELLTKNNTHNEAIVDEVDLNKVDGGDVEKVINKIKEVEEGKTKLGTGWEELNTMLDGGFIRGEQWVIYGLQHNFKSGFVHSIFCQLALNNKPVLTDKNKKPLLLFYSFEDSAAVIFEFFFKYLYYAEHGKLPDLSILTGKETATYIKDKLTTSGYYVKILRVDPTKWNYTAMFNKTLEYEADGYEIHAMFKDYLSKLPTTGCINNGPMGTDYRDLFQRDRSFCSAKNILSVTPHQISTEALQLLRNGVEENEFVKIIANRNYVSDSKQIPQVVDGEIYLHKSIEDRKSYLNVQRGKMRRPVIMDEKTKYFQLKFPYRAPIPPNVGVDAKEKTNDVLAAFDGL